MRTIALILDDNDFGATFRPLLVSLSRALSIDPGLAPDAVRHAIYAGIEFHYVAFQLRSRFNKPGHGKVQEVVDYLKAVKVLFDEEAEADVLNVGHDGGAWYLELMSGAVSAY